MDQFNNFLNAVNGVIWHNAVLYIVLAVGVLFTVWSVGCQYKALTHGVQVVRGKYDDKADPGAINHFQALSAALSATVGLGNIAGVALAIMLGGPGAVFWMWVVGVVGMALKTTEVTLSMIYRNTEDSDNPHGGPMFVAHKGLKAAGENGGKLGLIAGVVFAIVSAGAGVIAYLTMSGTDAAGLMPIVIGICGVLAVLFLVLGFMNSAKLGAFIGGVFVITLLVSTITGGNMFQAWNVADITNAYFGVPQIATGIFLAVVVGAVIIGGIKRIGAVAGRLVPFMCVVYLLAALYVIVMRFDVIPEMLKLIVVEAFSPTEATGAFLGGTAGYALLWGMKRALFSSEAGQGSSPIAHSAAKTDEPVREGVVAGLEPFIDTIVVCTLTSLVILSTGIWNRGPDLDFTAPTAAVQTDGAWSLERSEVVPTNDASLIENAEVFTIVEAEVNPNTGKNLHRVMGRVEIEGEGENRRIFINWSASPTAQDAIAVHPEKTQGAWFNHQGATLTAKAFDSVNDGLGMWLITLAAWLFAVSTMISWSYYGEQGVVYLFGNRAVFPYKILYCLAIVIASVPALISTDAQLDNLTALGTGVMLWANIPIMLIFGAIAMRTYKDYFRRMKAGEDQPHAAPPIVDVVEGHDIEKDN
jgi:AGCS family alanine or glycine:cation symporter